MGLSGALGVRRSVLSSYLIGSSRLVLLFHLRLCLPPLSDLSLLRSMRARHLKGLRRSWISVSFLLSFDVSSPGLRSRCLSR